MKQKAFVLSLTQEQPVYYAKLASRSAPPIGSILVSFPRPLFDPTSARLPLRGVAPATLPRHAGCARLALYSGPLDTNNWVDKHG